jgi:hypothetical protein
VYVSKKKRKRTLKDTYQYQAKETILSGLPMKMECIYVEHPQGNGHVWRHFVGKFQERKGELRMTLYDYYEKKKSLYLRCKLEREYRNTEWRNARMNKLLKDRWDGIVIVKSFCGNFCYDKYGCQVSLEKPQLLFFDEIGDFKGEIIVLNKHPNALVNLFIKMAKINGQRFFQVGKRNVITGDVCFWAEKIRKGSWDQIIAEAEKARPRYYQVDRFLFDALMGNSKYTTAKPHSLYRDKGLALLRFLIEKNNILKI